MPLPVRPDRFLLSDAVYSFWQTCQNPHSLSYQSSNFYFTGAWWRRRERRNETGIEDAKAPVFSFRTRGNGATVDHHSACRWSQVWQQTDKQNELNKAQNSKLKTQNWKAAHSSLNNSNSEMLSCPRTEFSKIQNTLVESEVIWTACIYVNFPACRRYTLISNSTVRVAALKSKPGCIKELSAVTDV